MVDPSIVRYQIELFKKGQKISAIFDDVIFFRRFLQKIWCFSKLCKMYKKQKSCFFSNTSLGTTSLVFKRNKRKMQCFLFLREKCGNLEKLVKTEKNKTRFKHFICQKRSNERSYKKMSTRTKEPAGKKTINSKQEIDRTSKQQIDRNSGSQNQ